MAGEELDFPHFNLENHLKQSTAEFLVPHDPGEDEVIGDVQIFPSFEFGGGLIFHSISMKKRYTYIIRFKLVEFVFFAGKSLDFFVKVFRDLWQFFHKTLPKTGQI